MLRPSEAVSLRRDDCSLPATGWGLAGADDPHWKTPEVSSAVDRRRVASPAQMEKLIAAIGTVGETQGPRLMALFGCLYYGMLRPSEAVPARRRVHLA